ncbi:MAG: tRNA (adenosine(37)-N6)-dimethylallyltransferase MiaA [Muribaculaceae bacterium]
MAKQPTLIVITGATASGKSALAIDVAERLGCEIISADSRQLFRDIPIGTAAPTAEQRAAVPHHLVGTLPLDGYYSAAQFEVDALAIANRLWERSPYVVVCGGSMMYVDALTDGIDELPTISAATRERVLQMLEQQGLSGLLAYLEILDPEYYAVVDRANTRRVVHAIEICLEAGVKYSQLRVRRRAERPFRIVKVAIDMPREQLFDRINRRVELMMEQGLLDEARRVYPLRHLNSLNTVGYKELFAYFDGQMDLPTATARIAKNTRVYAKKQLTWLARAGVRPTKWLPAAASLPALLRLL